MDNKERDRKLDQWLDEALSEYSAAEPRLGLEKRVLANVHAEQQSRAGRRSWWRWMPAFAAIAAVLIVMVAVRPYWEEKKVPAETAPTRSSNQTTATLQAEEKAVPAPSPKLASAEAAPRARKEVSAGKDIAIAKDGKADFGRVAEDKVATVKPAVPAAATNALDVANAPVKTAPAREVNKTQVLLDARRDVSVQSNLQPVMGAVPVAQPTPAPQKQVVGGIIAGAVSNGAPKANQNLPAGYTYNAQTIEVNPAVAQPVEAQSNAIATEKVAAMPEVTARQMKAMKAKAKPDSPLAKKLEENVETVTIPGMTKLRTDLKNVPLSQQFPSPTPLSEQEKLMMAASKQLKNKPASDEKRDVNDGDIKPIDIKNIEIAPLPGPPK